jgi:hypothetical protein
MQPELMSLGEKAGGALEMWQAAYNDIQGVGVGAKQSSGNLQESRIEDLSTRVTSGLLIIARLNGAKREQLELISHRLLALKTAVDAIQDQAKKISEKLNLWQGASATDLNGQLNLQLSHSSKGTLKFDLGNPLAAINQHATTLLDALPYIAQTVDDKSITVLGQLARTAAKHLLDAKNSANAVRTELEIGNGIVADLKGLADHASKLSTQAENVITSLSASKVTTEQHVAEVVQKLAQVREVSKDSDTLKQRVTSFASQFEAFETQMKARLELFSEFENSTNQAKRSNNERENKIAELTAKADTMIRGATTAGLSKSLEDTKGEYEKRLARTQWFFLGSVVFLLVSSLPVAAQLIPGPWQQYFLPAASDTAAASAPWLSAFGKLILVLPGTWATAFFASNYAELFHLSREYAHKAALAKAIDGFQREAPTYKQEIVGSVFMEIQDNPGSRRAPRPATPQNPVTKKFLEKVLEAFKTPKG